MITYLQNVPIQVSLRLLLDAGPILIMPTTFEPGDEATFTFRVFSRYPVRIRIMDVVPAVVGNIFSRVQELYGNSLSKSLKDFRQYEPLFNQVSIQYRFPSRVTFLIKFKLPILTPVFIPKLG